MATPPQPPITGGPHAPHHPLPGRHLPPAPVLAQPYPNLCRFCGSYPAAQVSVRAHRGIIILMTFRELDGPFCKTCGIAAVRNLSAQTLVQGWWGFFSALISPLMLLANFIAYLKIRALPEPAPNPPGPGLDPGKPLLQRWQSVGFVVPLAALSLFVVAVISHPGGFRQPDDVPVGQCVVNYGTDSGPDLSEVPCGVGTLQVLQRLSGTSSGTPCPAKTTKIYSHTGIDGSDSFMLCLSDYAN